MYFCGAGCWSKIKISNIHSNSNLHFSVFTFLFSSPRLRQPVAECWLLGSSALSRQRRLGANLIICLINSNFWWNVSRLVSVSLPGSRGKQRSLTAALLVLCEYKNDSDRISWIKSEHSQHTPSSWGACLGQRTFLNSHPCQNFFDYFNQIWKVTRSCCCVHVDKIIWDGLVCQSLSISCQSLVLTEQ